MESPNTACKTIHNINRLARRLAILTLIYSYDMLQHAYYPIAYTKQFCPTQILILNVIKSHSWTYRYDISQLSSTEFWHN